MKNKIEAGLPVITVPKFDNVENPSHYTSYKNIEVIQLVEQMNFNRGNIVKYVARAGLKDPDTELEDLRKARYYLDREIARVEEDNRLHGRSILR